MRKHYPSAIVILLMLAVLFGCLGGKSKTPHFYVLSSMKEDASAQSSGASHPGAVIGIGPITIADYLNRQDIVIRDGSNKLKMNEFEQWAGTFESNVSHALAENLGYLLSTDNIHIHPWRKSVPIDYQVALDLIRFDGKPDEQVWLAARWTIFKGPDKELVQVKRTSIQEMVRGGKYESLVAAQSQALAALSRQMAEVIMADQEKAVQ